MKHYIFFNYIFSIIDLMIYIVFKVIIMNTVVLYTMEMINNDYYVIVYY